MPNRNLLAGLAGLFVVLLIVGLSPLVEGDSGWKNTLGDVIWSGIFLTLAALVVLGVATVVRSRRRGTD